MSLGGRRGPSIETDFVVGHVRDGLPGLIELGETCVMPELLSADAFWPVGERLGFQTFICLSPVLRHRCRRHWSTFEAWLCVILRLAIWGMANVLRPDVMICCMDSCKQLMGYASSGPSSQTSLLYAVAAIRYPAPWSVHLTRGGLSIQDLQISISLHA